MILTSWWNYPARFEKDGNLAVAETVTDETVVTETIGMENETATEIIAATGTTETVTVTVTETLGTAVNAGIGIVGMEENPTGVTWGTLICRWDRIPLQPQPQLHLHRLREVFTEDHLRRLRLHQRRHNFMRRR